ncbi:MAG TPA: TMEM165/GDT1 family protein [Acidimicrobiales bacterium]|nr:TMEM165/GDT1 family protein [Acidimicrobiales bacterium]
MSLSVAAAVFPLVFLGELPDKTMFASLLLASRGRPLAVWLGSVAAFAVHVVIAVGIGVALFHLISHRALDVAVGAIFLAGAVYAFVSRSGHGEGVHEGRWTGRNAALTSALVIFLAEWGDLTQIITANLAARYHRPLTVGLAAFAALVTVSALAVVAGTGVLRFVSVRTARLVIAVVLIGLAAYTFAQAAAG